MEKSKFRCHFSIVIENLGAVFWALLAIIISDLDSFVELIKEVVSGHAGIKEVLAGTGVAIVFLLIVFIYNFWIWRKTWISIDQDAIIIEKNLLNRKVNTIGMKNISNINMEQNLFERLVGTYKLKLDTNSATTADETDVKIVLSKNKAEEFKKMVMLHMNESYEAIVEDREEYDVEYSDGDIVKHCIYTTEPSALIILLGFIGAAVYFLGTLDTGVAIINTMAEALGGVLAAVIVLWSVIQSLVKDFFVYYEFKARRQDDKIYLSHGLFKKRQYTISVDKINAVSVVAPLFARITGREYVKVYCVGVGDEENENSMLVLCEKRDKMLEHLSVLLPEYILEQPEMISREKMSYWKEIIINIFSVTFWGALGIMFGVLNVLDIPASWICGLIIAFAIFMIIVNIIGSFLSFKTCKIGLGKDVLFNSMGKYEKNTTLIPYRKIQKLEYESGPIIRKHGLANGTINILASVLDSFHITSYYKTDVFEDIRKKMLIRKGKQ